MRDPLRYAHVNYYGTVNVLETAVQNKVKNFVFASSSSVYGGRTNVPFREIDDIGKPVSQYAATKAAGELVCYTYHSIYKMPVTCLRFFTVYGPNQRPYGMAHQKFIKLIFRGEKIPVYGDGSMKRDYTYIDDTVSGIISSLDKDLPYEVMNLGSENMISVNELIREIEKAMGKRALVENLPCPPTEVPITYADISKARRLLGYEPKTNFSEGVKKQVEFFMGAPDWYKNLPDLR